LLDEVFRADGVVEALANGDFAEGEAVKGRVGCHTGSIKKWPKCKKPNRGGWAKCKNHNKNLWLLDLGSNQGPTD
jgi:hypothetical protein